MPQQVLPNVSAWHCPCYSQAAATLLQERHTCNISAVQHFLADILHDFSHLMSQVGGFKAQRSWVTALSWAAMPTLSSSSSSSPPSSSHPEQHHHAQLQQQDQLLLITGSSDGCLRLHSQSVESLGEATVQSAGALVEGEQMQLRKTLHEADLLGVTCLAVKLREASSSGKLLSPGSRSHQTRATTLNPLQSLQACSA